MRISDWSSDVCSSDLFLEREVFLSFAHVDRALEELKDDLAVLDVLRERRDPQLVVFIEEVGEVLVVLLVVIDLFRLFEDARTLFLQLRLAVKELRSEEHTSELQSLMRISYAVF